MTQKLSFHPESAFARDALERLERVVTDLVQILGNLGALVAIEVNGLGQAFLTAGHSDLARMRPVQPGDIVQIGSQTKTLTAVALYLIAKEGSLDLDDPVVKYLDLPIHRQITIRHLLMNTSGLGEFTFALGERFDERLALAPRDLIALALPQGQLFSPGVQFDYCNTGWVIAAMLIQAVEGKSYHEVVDERIIAPLGLSHTAVGGKVPAGEAMRAYKTFPWSAEPVDITEALSWAFGAGDGFSTAQDLLCFYQSLLRKDSPLGISLQDLISHTAKPSATPHFPLSLGVTYGLGLECRAWAGREVWGHPGSTEGTRSSTWIDPVVGVAVVTSVTTHVRPDTGAEEIRYPRAQLFSMALNTAYTLAERQ